MRTAVEANLKTPEGKAYDEKLGKEFSTRNQALRQDSGSAYKGKPTTKVLCWLAASTAGTKFLKISVLTT